MNVNKLIQVIELKKLIWTVLIALLLVGCGDKPKEAETAISEEIIKEPQPEYIDIVSCGDNLYHMPVINSGKQADGSYDYSEIYTELQPMIKDADISVICQETVFAGEDVGYSGYPTFNSPDGVGKTIANEGFDIVLHASNHTMDKWTNGVERTLEFWKKYPDITVLGIHESKEADEKVEIIEKKGAKIAVLNYTYGTNGIPVPSEKAYLVELINEENIEKDAKYAEENSDFTIAFMHWGTEYSTKPDSYQKALAKKMADWGVDLIIGSHPHVIEPVEYIVSENGNKVPVYYSLGNFVSRQLDAINLLGGVAKVRLKVFEGEVSIENHSFMPIVTHYNAAYNSFKVYPLGSYTNEIASGHGVIPHDGAVSKERFMKMVDDVFEGYDKSVIEY